ncbi:MAG TPA: CHAT domain-containing protein [Proteobacteria bacterium]|nr:CHAT domain-containing protein [Pseudomonadota bacterium]
MDEQSTQLEVAPSAGTPIKTPQEMFPGYIKNYQNRLDLSAAEISELWELLKKDTITLDQAFEIVTILGHQWHPQAEKALTDCYLKLENPLSNWAALAIGSYYTYSSLVNIKDILTRELEDHFANRGLRSRAETMLSEIERRLAPPEFVKLEIKIDNIDRADASPHGYKTEIIRSSHFAQDEGIHDTFSFSDTERSRIETFLQTWQVRTMSETNLSEIGVLLYQKVFGGKLCKCLDNCLLRSRQDARFAGVAFTLHLTDRWLMGLPWSCLYQQKERHFLVRDCDVTIALRLLTEPSALRPWDGSRTTRLLVIRSQPDSDMRRALLQAGIGLVDVDTKKEKANFSEGLKKWNRDSDRLLSIDIVHARDDEIFKRMSDNRFDYDAVHYFGHCLHDGERPYLVFEDARGSRGPLRTAQDFVNLVGKNRALQLVTLVACQSAVRTTGAATHGSLAGEFLAAGVPTVVAMQTAIRRSTGLTFARHFYHELIRTGSAVTAFHKAVQAITVRPPGNVVEPEWAAPAFFVRR